LQKTLEHFGHKMEVINKIKIYDDDNKKPLIPGEFLEIRNHWNKSDFVILMIGSTKVQVLARELEAAIKNATNTVRV